MGSRMSVGGMYRRTRAQTHSGRLRTAWFQDSFDLGFVNFVWNQHTVTNPSGKLLRKGVTPVIFFHNSPHQMPAILKVHVRSSALQVSGVYIHDLKRNDMAPKLRSMEPPAEVILRPSSLSSSSFAALALLPLSFTAVHNSDLTTMHRGGAQRSRSNSQYPNFDDEYGPSLRTGEHMEHDGFQFRTGQRPQRQYGVQETLDFDGPGYPSHVRNNRTFRISKSMGSIATMAPLATAQQPTPRFPSSNAVHAEDTSVLLARLEAMSLKQEQLEQRNEELEAIVAGIPRGGGGGGGGIYYTRVVHRLSNEFTEDIQVVL
ncbi:hypothetical protein B0H13DRAFT_2261068 [Mycena leptocephala]|nr:hypothetical protein B0H13DRAFT_2261068 [Mycena leptocephala]